MATSRCTSTKDSSKLDSSEVLAARHIYKNYIQTYIPIMMSCFHKVTLFHAFAGAGRDKESEWPEEIEKYSPAIIALRVAIHYFKRLGKEYIEFDNDREINIDGYLSEIGELMKVKGTKNVDDSYNHRGVLIFVESNRRLYKELVKNVIKVIKMYRLRCEVDQDFKNGMCKVWCDFRGTSRASTSYVVACYIVLADFTQVELPKGPCSAYIDPIDFTGVQIETVKRFVCPTKEVIVHLKSGYLKSCIGDGHIVSHDSYRSTLEKNIAALHGLTLSDADRGSDRNELTEIDVASKVFHCFEETLKRDTGIDMTLSFEFHKESNICTSYFLFVTNHMRSFKNMKESMMKVSPDSKSFSLSVESGLGNLANDQDSNDVASEIYKHFKGRTAVVSEVADYVWLKTPYVFRKKPLEILERNGYLSVKDSGIARRRGTFPDRSDWELVFTLDK